MTAFDPILLVNLPAAQSPPWRERGFAFRVPISRRKLASKALEELGRQHGFEVDHVGPLGGIRCTYRDRDADKVHAFISSHLRGTNVRMIADYQKRYGVVED